MLRTKNIITVGLVVQALFASDPEQSRPSRGKILEPASNFDRAIGFMDAGKMKVIGVENFGLLSGWDPPTTGWYPGAKHGKWGEIRWIAPVLTMPPGPWGANIQTPDGVKDRSDQYNTIESFSSCHLHQGDGMAFSDWEAKDNASLKLHGTATEDNIPMIAISTMPETWPQGYYDSLGTWVSTPDEHHWPGKWALDPDPDSPTFNESVEDMFTSDKDIFFIMDDKYNGVRSGANTARYGYPIGIDVEVSGYSYASIWYEDIVFFNMNIIYRTEEEITNPSSPFYDPDRHYYNGTIDSVYFSFFVDPDLPGAFLENSRQASPWAEDDYASVEDIDGDGKMDICLMYDKQDYFHDYTNGNKGTVSAYGIHFFKTPRTDPGDPNSPEVGITGFHWFDQDDVMRPHTIDADWEKVLYAISAGNPDLLPAEERNKWFHGSNPKIDELETLQSFQESFGEGSRPDIQFWFSSGPFSISPGDTIPIHVGIVGGRPEPGGLDADGFPVNPSEVRFEDVYSNLYLASALYQSNFIGAKPPSTPKLSASGTLTKDEDDIPLYYGENEQVTLFWDNSAESSVDLISKEQDFEGYRIYRALVNYKALDVDWGEEIYDYYGEIMGYIPIAQYDRKNGWSGFDPYNQYYFLGENSGLQYNFVDNDVINGLRYRYAVTAYDYPFDSLHVGANESFIGIDSRAINIIDIIPGVQPSGFVDGQVEIEIISGQGTGEINIEVVDPIAIEESEYMLTFYDSTGSLLYSVYDNTTGLEILTDCNLIWNEETSGSAYFSPVFNGIHLSIINHENIEFLGKRWIEIKGDTSQYSFSDLYLPNNGTAVNTDYLVVFGDSTSKYPESIVPGGEKVPFQVFNLLADPDTLTPLFLAIGNNPYQPWFSGDNIQIIEPSWPQRTWYFQIFWDSTSIAPSAGDQFLLQTKKNYTSADTIKITTKEAEIENKAVLGDIKVVPNPYIVSSLTDIEKPNEPFKRDLRFINLPPECKIDIYTLNGDRIKTIHHNSTTIGEAHWNMLTDDNLEISYGMYLYAVTTPDGQEFTGKFGIIW